jgi:hypothetical protein
LKFSFIYYKQGQTAGSDINNNLGQAGGHCRMQTPLEYLWHMVICTKTIDKMLSKTPHKIKRDVTLISNHTYCSLRKFAFCHFTYLIGFVTYPNAH